MWGWAAGIVTSLFGEKKTTGGELAKDLSSGLDVIWHTAEEKAQMDESHRNKVFDLYLKLQDGLKGSEAQRSVTRRILAIGTFANAFSMMWVSLFAEIHAYIVSDATYIAAGELKLTALTWAVLRISAVFQIGWIVVSMVIFYYGPHAISLLKGFNISKKSD